MSGIDPPGTDWQRRRRPAISANQGYELCGCDDVYDGVDCAHFVKRNGVHLDAMHLGFGFGEKLEDRERVLLHIRAQVRATELSADVNPCLVAVPTLVSVRVAVAAIGARPRNPRGLLRRIPSNKKSASSEGMIMMRGKPAFSFGPKVQGRNRRPHVWPVFGEGVQKSRNEHIAG
jgi:hypothetical protein